MYNAFAFAERWHDIYTEVSTRTEQHMARSHRQVCTMEGFSLSRWHVVCKGLATDRRRAQCRL